MNKRKKNKRGKFVVLEGLDGSGTTTQSQLLAKYLQEEKWPVFRTSEPTQGPVGLILRLMLSNRLVFHTHEMDLLANSSVALLFAGDRLDHLQHTVLPKLEEGIIVICERYYLSSYAYQMGEDPKNLEWLTTINSRCIQPDITFFLKTSLSISEKRRARDRWYQELYEKPQILGQVEKNYDFVIEKIKQNHTPIEIVDGNSSEKVVFGQIVSAFKKNFPEMFPKDVPLFENR